jgi:hypothetical protein
MLAEKHDIYSYPKQNLNPWSQYISNQRPCLLNHIGYQVQPSTSLFVDFTLEHAIRKVQVNRDRLKLVLIRCLYVLMMFIYEVKHFCED